MKGDNKMGWVCLLATGRSSPAVAIQSIYNSRIARLINTAFLLYSGWMVLATPNCAASVLGAKEMRCGR
ncbi:hypothetical protein BaRGS_00004824 [Batillaria attramentaria]|uniref:Uncharacterized protein n=1 Tax=Batillaria attramentaria TaxID=370345 RepID=A0ABD0LX58_9CAEN